MEQFLFTNVLQIPSLFSSPYEQMARLGFLLFSVMFIVAILHENLEAIRGGSDYTGLFLRVLLVVGLLVFYERFFVWIVYTADLLSKAVLSQEEFKEVIRAVFHEVLQQKDFGVLKFFSIITVLNFITYAVAMALLGILGWLRFVFLALLYVFGPLLAGAAVYKGSSQGLTFWLRSVVSVSLWSVVLSILMKVISTMNLTAVYLPEETNSVAVFAANLLFIVLFVSVPLISQQITSHGSLGGLGSAVVGLGTAFIAKNLFKPASKPRGRQ